MMLLQQGTLSRYMGFAQSALSVFILVLIASLLLVGSQANAKDQIESGDLSTTLVSSSTTRLDLTPAEQQWLALHPRFC